MAQTKQKQKKKPIGKMAFFGIVSIALYAALLLEQEIITDYFSHGGVMYALLPIGTAFIFSFVHGSFTGSFWTVMGIRSAKKKKEVK